MSSMSATRVSPCQRTATGSPGSTVAPTTAFDAVSGARRRRQIHPNSVRTQPVSRRPRKVTNASTAAAATTEMAQRW